jgi:ribosomal-protein-alanine N-acetyltransferase
MEQWSSIIQTERLSLRPLTVEDVEAIHRIWTDAGVRKFLWDDEIISLDEARGVIEKSVTYFRCTGLGLWAILPHNEERIIGFCGYWFFHEPPQLELLYGLVTEEWRRGLATEAAGAMLRYGFDELGFEEIQASTDAANLASQRVMGRLGMRCTARKDAEGLDTIFYSITKKDVQYRPFDDEVLVEGKATEFPMLHG